MADRPDLDEFLGSLSGFLNKKDLLPEDPTYFRFLEIFCRSVSSGEGHLLYHDQGKGLHSIVSCGLPKDFELQFNEGASKGNQEPSPLDIAFREQQVVAVAEFNEGAELPAWFLKIMETHELKSLVAVPLMGQTRAVGVLCAYYRDACLFDQGTMDRLMTLGRMVGSAMENSTDMGSGNTAESSFSSVDAYLKLLTTETLTKEHVYLSLTKVLAQALSPSGLVCGPLHMGESGLLMTVVDGTGVPPDSMAQHFTLPPFLSKKIILGQGESRQAKVEGDMWGSLAPLVAGKVHSSLCQAIVWDKRSQAVILVWRSDKKPFTEFEELTVGRLAAIASLALRSL